MKRIFNKVSGLLTALVLMFASFGCESTDLEVQPSPNFLAPDQPDTDLFLNAIEQGLAAFHSGIEGSNFDGMSEFGLEPVRMLHASGPSYFQLNEPADFNRVWRDAYSETLADIRGMNPLAEELGQFSHIAVGQIIEAYLMITLVDYFGDVPYSEAIQGSEGNVNPVVDSSVSIYEAALQLLDDAIENFGRPELGLPAADLFFPGEFNQATKTSWIKVANTIRLKIYLQTRLANETSFNAAASTSAINALIAEGNLIFSESENWQYQYGTTLAAPDSRHPFFEKNYGGAGPNADFIFANYYMDLLANQYSQIDPRTRYYFYRQVGNFNGADVVTNSCSTQLAPPWYSADEIFCQVANENNYNGMWGWDHLRADGIPPHEEFLTMFGVYPVGGPFDDQLFRDVSGSAAINEGLQGAGIAPFLMSSYTYFMLAEASLTLGTTGDARTYLESGIRESISTVVNFGERLTTLDNPSDPDDENSPSIRSLYVPTTAAIDTHVAEILAAYDAGDDTAKLKIIVEQYFIALYGNGIEAYNTYRRTGQPSDLQPSVDLENPGVFVRSHFYPLVAALNNQNITQKSDVTTPVFWDTNPEGFVD